MTLPDFISGVQNTWCPGCGNFAIQHTMKNVFMELAAEGVAPESLVMVSGIGCHAKIADYFNLNSFYTLHGRTLPVATGIKLANRDLTVICHAGDGDALAEGLDHLIFAAKRNIDLTVILHDNRVYGLTTGQYTPTSSIGFRGRSTPRGTTEFPLNPMRLMLASGATFVARGYTRRMPQLKSLVRAALAHRGFAFIDVLQICASYANLTDYYEKRVYELEGHDTGSYDEAARTAGEWDYSSDSPIPLGLIYQKEAPVFETVTEKYSQGDSRKDIVRHITDSRT
jgi:2-oxoglutarate ferredoxin oxidoreductase subunit beta